MGRLIMGRITGLEPATFGTTNQRSNQLSYIRHTESCPYHFAKASWYTQILNARKACLRIWWS